MDKYVLVLELQTLHHDAQHVKYISMSRCLAPLTCQGTWHDMHENV